MAKPFRVLLKLRNNLLIEAREKKGLNSASAAARAVGIDVVTFCGYEALTRRPYNSRSGKWAPSALKIADYFGMLPEDLWPEVIASVEKARAEIKLDMEQVTALTSGSFAEQAALPAHEKLEKAEMEEVLKELLDTLSSQQAMVLRKRFGLEDGNEQTLSQIASSEGCSTQNIRYLERKALHKLRSSSMEKLRSLLD